MNQYQDSRRVLNPGLQEEPRQIKQRSISQTAKLLTWEPQPAQKITILKRDDKIFGQQPITTKPPPKRVQDRIFGQEIEQRLPTRGNLKNESNLFKDCEQTEIKMRRKVPMVQHQETIQRKKMYKDRNEGHGAAYLYGQSDKENRPIPIPKPQLVIEVQETIPSQRVSVKSKTISNQRTSKSCHQKLEQQQIVIPKEPVQEIQKPSPKQRKFKPPMCASRPQSAMCDRSIDIIEMQLGGTKNQDEKYFKDLCQKQGFHMVDFQEQVNALRDTGHAKMMMRGVSNPHKLNYIHQQLDAKGITIEQPRHQLKNILQNDYLLELNKYEKQQQSQDQLIKNFQKFYQRQHGQIF